MSEELSVDTLAEVSVLVASAVGLHFPPERWPDLSRALSVLAAQEGFVGPADYSRWLLSSTLSRERTEKIAQQLTVGETYFFRDPAALRALEQQVLPRLIDERRASGERRLRIWSAGCCTGEEPYTIAIMLERLVPDIIEWNVTILASDINTRFLRAAREGTFGAWSLRAIPPDIRERCFTPGASGRFTLAHRIRKMVTFSVLNLAEDAYPSLLSNTNAMDLVLCRNVLMYFTPGQASRTASNLRAALADDGWLLVAPCETSQVQFHGLTAVNFPGAILYSRTPLPADAALPTETLPPMAAFGDEHVAAREWSESRRDAAPNRDLEPLHTPLDPSPAATPPAQVDAHLQDALALANKGELSKAMAACDLSIAADGADAGARFLRGMIAIEMGMLDEARRALEQAIYLDPDFVMAHVSLGSLAGRLGRTRQSRRHLRAALHLLSRLPPGAAVSDAAGLTAGRIIEAIRSAGGAEGGEG